MDLLVNIDVDDMSKAAAFYQQAAGLCVGRRFGSLGMEMLGASSAVYLLAKPPGTAPSSRTGTCVVINGIGRQCISTSSLRKSRTP